MQTIQALYTATVTATGGRDGRAISTDGNLDVRLATPRELGGQGGNATTRSSSLRQATRPASSVP